MGLAWFNIEANGITALQDPATFSNLVSTNVSGSSQAALQQIADKGYARPYAADSRKVYQVGISFSSKTGTIDGFDYLPRE